MKIFLIILAAIAILLTLVLSLRLSIRIKYNESFTYVLRYGPIRLDKFITGKKKSKTKKKGKSQKGEKKQKPPLLETISLISDIVKAFSSKFFTNVNVKLARIIVTVAGEDPAKTAVKYGLTCQACAFLVEILKRQTKYSLAQNAVTQIEADFTAKKSKTDIDIKLSVSTFTLLRSAFAAAFAYLKKKTPKINTRKE